jgi:copper(I)-binding protein
VRDCAAFATACLTLLACTLALAAAPPLTAQDAWIRATPGSDVAAAYLTLHNAGTQAVSIVGVRCACAAHAMIHESTLSNGQSSMRPRESLAVAAGTTLRFAPGGLHIMLEGLTRALTPGEQVPLELLLDGGGSLSVSARVRALGDG